MGHIHSTNMDGIPQIFMGKICQSTSHLIRKLVVPRFVSGFDVRKTQTDYVHSQCWVSFLPTAAAATILSAIKAGVPDGR
ncbi:hypothetical protein E2C01_008114 [Portunus trituberculatus]|uniref:Uncharacterized protein n=1 Tax=Portunus trituberculatus TaxID=210409 RepID=A0A5B7D3Z6_PORTR|nr:hypothetical protein [Portunus trituberculatus]